MYGIVIAKEKVVILVSRLPLSASTSSLITKEKVVSKLPLSASTYRVQWGKTSEFTFLYASYMG